MRRLLLAIVALMLLAWPAAHAVQPDEIMSDPAKELRARERSRELRCMVCQNQSIDDSDAPLARDLRILVRERLVAGESNAQVLDFLVKRYGEFVLQQPRFTFETSFDASFGQGPGTGLGTCLGTCFGARLLHEYLTLLPPIKAALVEHFLDLMQISHDRDVKVSELASQ